MSRGRQERRTFDQRIQHERGQQDERLAHERAERWRDRLVFAAVDFSIGIEQSALGARNVMDAVKEKGDVASAAIEAKRLNHEVIARHARIKLLFGGDSPTAELAKELVSELELARQAAEDPDTRNAWFKLSEVYDLHQKFIETAREAIRDPRV